MATQKFGTLGSIHVRRGGTVQIEELITKDRYIGIVHGWEAAELTITGTVRVFDGRKTRYYHAGAPSGLLYSDAPSTAARFMVLRLRPLPTLQ